MEGSRHGRERLSRAGQSLGLQVEGTTELRLPEASFSCAFSFWPDASRPPAPGDALAMAVKQTKFMAAETLENITQTGRKLAGKYLTFVLGQESYGIAVLTIREIIRMTDITAVPRMPDYVKGVINLRGKVIPIVDLRLKFRLARVEMTERTCIIVVQVNTAAGQRVLMGLIVDAVEEVLNVAAADIEQAPDFGTKLETDYILGMAKIKERVKTLLDIDRVISAEALLAPAATHAA